MTTYQCVNYSNWGLPNNRLLQQKEAHNSVCFRMTSELLAQIRNILQALKKKYNLNNVYTDL